MPISGTPYTIPGGYPYSVNIPLPDGTPFSLYLQITSDGSTGEDTSAMDAALQSLIDHFQTWEGRRPDANVSGDKRVVLGYTVTATNPITPPDPPQPQ